MVDLDDKGRIFGIVGVSERMFIASPGKINIDNLHTIFQTKFTL